MQFELRSKYSPAGDQPKAIAGLIKSLGSGYKHQTLLGVTGSGKSVVKNTPVLIKQAGITKRVAIGSKIDALFQKYHEKQYSVGDTKYINLSELPVQEQFNTLSFSPDSKIQSWEQVVQISRHQSPHTLRKITTTCGRSVTITDDHNFFVLRNGALELLPTSALRNTDWIPAPTSLPGPSTPLQSIDLLKITGALPRAYYATAPLLQEAFKKYKKEVYAIAGYRKTYGALHQNERLSVQTLAKLATVEPTIIAGAKVGSVHRTLQLPAKLQLTPGILRLFAYYIAEGCAAQNYITISSGSQEIINDLQNTCQNLGLSAVHRPGTYDYQLSSSLLRDTLVSLCGKGSYEKHLPDFWPELSNEQLSNLLSAYFACDGGIDGDKVTATTASETLASDLVLALLRFDIHARIKERRIKIPQSERRGLYYCVRISGRADLLVFQDTIGFFIKAKEKKLTTIIKPSSNTNVDVIPWGRELKELRFLLHLYQKDIAKTVNVERSYISMVENGKRFPSRPVFTRLIDCLLVEASSLNLSDIIHRLQNIRGLANLAWTPIKSIEPLKGEEYVYDFSVKQNETFLAGRGGLFVHNTFTMANVVQHEQRPTLVMCHNKTLAAQLASEFQEFFPNNAVHYFVSYYDYYQPEAYIPRSDTFIEKETQINEEIDRLRNAATQSLLTRKDVLIVASVSCIYGLGNPGDYMELSIEIKKGQSLKRDKFLRRLTDLQFHRNDMELKRATFRAQGDVVEIVLASEDTLIRLDFFGDEVEKIERRDLLTGDTLDVLESIHIFPAKHFVATEQKIYEAIENIRNELLERLSELRGQGKILEAARLEQRTNFDLEMLTNTGFVAGIENYSRHLDGRTAGDPPSTLIDYFPDDFLLFIDESHQTIPQVGGMYNGDRARKMNLVDYGFRLPSAMDNRPLQFAEFEHKVNQVVYVSATPGPYELQKSLQENQTIPRLVIPASEPESRTKKSGSRVKPGMTPGGDLRGITVVEQIIRPTGLIDPTIEVKPIKHQVDDLLEQIVLRTKKHERVLVTTLTKRMSEELTEYLKEAGVKVQYIHSEVETFDRLEILRDLRLGVFDVLVGINLLREGLDLPEVSLVAILDADKEGFLRSETAFMQIMGRAARHLNGHVIMYADRMTGSMERAITETTRRRKLQEKYNTDHGITPASIIKAITDTRLAGSKLPETYDSSTIREVDPGKLSKEELKYYLDELNDQMDIAARNLEFELAATLRDKIANAKKLSKLTKTTKKKFKK